MSVGHLYVFFGEVPIQALCPFLIGLLVLLVLGCISSLYMLDINPLSEFIYLFEVFYPGECTLWRTNNIEKSHIY